MVLQGFPKHLFGVLVIWTSLISGVEAKLFSVFLHCVKTLKYSARSFDSYDFAIAESVSFR